MYTIDLVEYFEKCEMCPRDCKVNRLKGEKNSRRGVCGESENLRVAYIGPHFGEEPPITGETGSGTIFFSGCSLKCSYCQNYQISRDGIGESMNLNQLYKKTTEMIHTHNVQNINFVTPDHFFPFTFKIVSRLRDESHDIPILYNLSGYQSIYMLKMAEKYADIYLPDFKYVDKNLAWKLSDCRNYPVVALDAISEMIRQKGFLSQNDMGQAEKGVLVRHLILPGHIEHSINVLTTLLLEFGPQLPLSLMSQYRPVTRHKDECMNRSLKKKEFDRVYTHALDLGFETLFVQFPDDQSNITFDIPFDITSRTDPFLPDFRLKRPFSSKNPSD